MLTDASYFRFSPKEDVSSSTSLKSSVQRNIRSNLVSQFPLLSQPAHKAAGGPSKKDSAPEPDSVDSLKAEDDAEDGVAGDEDEVETGGKGKGKGKGGKKSKGKGGKSKRDKDEDDEDAGAAGSGGGTEEVTVMDEIWPKKEALGLTKW